MCNKRLIHDLKEAGSWLYPYAHDMEVDSVKQEIYMLIQQISDLYACFIEEGPRLKGKETKEN